MRNKQYLIILGIIFITVLCVFLYSRNSLENKVIKELDDCVKAKRNLVSFDKVSNNFDSLMVLGCYTNTEKIEKNFGIDLNATGIIRRDDIILIVLLKNRKIVKTVYLRVYKYHTTIFPPKIFPKNYQFKLTRKSGVTDISE